MVQLPLEALGLAIGVLSYSFICLVLGMITSWLVWAHRERTSYIFALAVVTSIGTVASIAQQIHTIVWWRDVKVEQYQHAVANAGTPELAIAGASFGLDLVLFYTQFTSYNVVAFLIFFWCAALLQTVFQLRGRGSLSRYRGFFVKIIAILIPVFLVSLLQVPAIRSSTVAFLSVANCCMAVGVTGSACMILVILGRYIYTRQQLLSWNVQYGTSSIESENPTLSSTATTLRPRYSIYDKWLLVRFTLGFIMLGIFQILVIMFQIRSVSQNTRENLGDSPNLSLSRITSDFLSFMPGVSPPLVVFVVFGTTTPFRKYMYEEVVPMCFRGGGWRNGPFSGAGERLSAPQGSLELQVYQLSRY